eukprot:6199338-Pleurochrysis_carterae.AAC.1
MVAKARAPKRDLVERVVRVSSVSVSGIGGIVNALDRGDLRGAISAWVEAVISMRIEETQHRIIGARQRTIGSATTSGPDFLAKRGSECRKRVGMLVPNLSVRALLSKQQAERGKERAALELQSLTFAYLQKGGDERVAGVERNSQQRSGPLTAIMLRAARAARVRSRTRWLGRGRTARKWSRGGVGGGALENFGTNALRRDSADFVATRDAVCGNYSLGCGVGLR